MDKIIKSQKQVQACALFLFALVLALSLFRIHFGVSFNDESFYVALPYRYVLGDQIFKDDWMLLQTFSLLSLPLVKTYHAFKGVEGLMLFMRVCFVVFSLCVGAVLFHVLKGRAGRALALLFALLPLSFVPFSIPNLSYNTWGVGFWVMGCFLGWFALNKKEYAPLYSAWAGITQGLAAAAHPSLVVGVCAYALIYFFYTRKEKKILFPFYVAGGLLIALWVVSQLPWAEFENARNFSFSENGRRLTGAKAFSVLRDFFYWGPNKLVLLLLGAGGIWISKRRPEILLWLLAFLPLLCWVKPGPTSLGALQIALYFALMGFFLFLCSWRIPAVRRLFTIIWLPSMLAGLATAMASTNHTTMAGLGSFPAAIATLLMLFETQRWCAKQNASFTPWPSFLAGSLLVGLFLSHHLLVVYSDAPLAKLKAHVQKGPYAGLYTSPERAAFLQTLSQDLSRVENADARILFYDFFPAGYLLTNMRPATPTVWNCAEFSQARKTACVEYYRNRLKDTNVVVQMKSEPIEDLHLHRFVNRYHTPIRERKDYTIYSLRKNKDSEG